MYDEKYELDFGKMLRAVRRFKRTGIVVALGAMSLMVFGNKMIFPDQYEASALVRVKTDLIHEETRRNDLVRVVQEEILSRTVLESVAKQLELDKPFNGKKTLVQTLIESITGRETAVRPQSMDNIIRDMRSDVSVVETVSSQGGTTVFMVSMKDDNPKTVSKVVNAIVDTYILHKSTFKADDSQRVVEFLKQQVDGKRQDLMVVTKKLEFFKNANSKYLNSEANVASALYNARLRLVAAESRAAQSHTLISDTQEAMQSLPRTISSAAARQNVDPNNLSPQERLVFMEQRLIDYSTRYTADHPDVVRTRREVEQLRAALGSNTNVDSPVVTSSTNPEYLRLRSELSNARSELQSANAEIRLIRREIANLEEVQSKLPQVSQMLTTLENAKMSVERDYTRLQTRLTEASIASQAAMTTVGSSFSVVDPAVTPTSPTVRSRLVLHLFGAVFGIGLGLGSSLILGLVVPEKNEMNIVIDEDDVPTEQVSLSEGRLGFVFIVSAFVILMMNIGYMVIDFLKQAVVFV